LPLVAAASRRIQREVPPARQADLLAGDGRTAPSE